MKKLIAIVMVLMMAFAGTALAITDNAVASASADGWIPVALNAIPGVPTTATGAGFNWTGYVVDNQAVQVNQVVYLDLVVNIGNVYNDWMDNAGVPNNTVSQLVVNNGFNINLEATGLNMLYTNNITAYCANIYGVTHNMFNVNINVGKTTSSKIETRNIAFNQIVYSGFSNYATPVNIWNGPLDSTVAHFVFYALVSAANPTIKATVAVGAGSMEFSPAYPAAGTAPAFLYNIYSGNDVQYKIAKFKSNIAPAPLGGSGNVYVIFDSNGTQPLVAFKLKSNGTLDDGAIYVNLFNTLGPVTGPTTTTPAFIGTFAAGNQWRKVYKNYAVGTVSGWVVEDFNYAIFDAAKVNLTVKAAGSPVALSTFVQDIFNFFNFDFAKNGVVNDASFLSLGGAFNYVATKDWTTVEDVVVDPADDTDDAEIPPTADTASTFGFVMIGVAIIAAASLAVVAKKSR